MKLVELTELELTDEELLFDADEENTGRCDASYGCGGGVKVP